MMMCGSKEKSSEIITNTNGGLKRGIRFRFFYVRLLLALLSTDTQVLVGPSRTGGIEGGGAQQNNLHTANQNEVLFFYLN